MRKSWVRIPFPAWKKCREINGSLIEAVDTYIVELKSDHLIKHQGFQEKLYFGAIIEKIVEELKNQIDILESQIGVKIKQLY